MSRLLLIISLLLPLLIFPSCIVEEDGSPDIVAVGMRVPSFEVTTLSGEVFSTRGDLHGEMLIVFFNTECPDCQRELPVIQQYYEETLALPAGQRTRVICISREEGAGPVGSYWQRHGFTMPVAACEDRAVYSLFATSGIPRIYRVTDGIITSISFCGS